MFNSPFSLMMHPTHTLLADHLKQVNRFFSQLTGNEPLKKVPAYDICTQGNNQYAITVSVPGFREEELTINASDGQIVIEGQREDPQDNTPAGWLHRGISRENFSLTLALKEGIQVQNANLDQGLLTINLLQEMPKSEKFKKITIGNSRQSVPVLAQQE